MEINISVNVTYYVYTYQNEELLRFPHETDKKLNVAKFARGFPFNQIFDCVDKFFYDFWKTRQRFFFFFIFLFSWILTGFRRFPDHRFQARHRTIDRELQV